MNHFTSIHLPNWNYTDLTIQFGKVLVKQLFSCQFGEVVITKWVPGKLCPSVCLRGSKLGTDLACRVYALLRGARGSGGGGAGWSGAETQIKNRQRFAKSDQWMYSGMGIHGRTRGIGRGAMASTCICSDAVTDAFLAVGNVLLPDWSMDAHLDLLRPASAAAACSSWVDLLTGTPNMALCVTSLRMRLWPPRGATLGDEGGVREPTLWPERPPANG